MTDYSPWHPITEPKTLKHLGKLLEELGELTAAVSRCIIQGLNEKEPVTGKNNFQWLTEEIADVQAQIKLTIDYLCLSEKEIALRRAVKMEKCRAWHDMA